MPELPEVRHHSEKLRDLFKKCNLEKIVIHRGPYLNSEKTKYETFRKSVSDYKPHLIKDVKTKGKYMYFLLEGEQYYALGIHHGMEGSWCDDPSNKHIILELVFAENKKIFFQDSRRFGTFSFLSENELQQQLDKLGEDVLELQNYPEFWNIIKNNKKIQKRRLCEVLLDQTVVSGIGNYLRADIMYHAKLNPQRIINSLSDEEIKTLYNSIKNIVQKSYDSKATTTGSYSSSIHNGNYVFLIYGRNKCPLGHKVDRFQDKQKRTVWYVPELQK